MELGSIALVLWAGAVADGADLWFSVILGWGLLTLAAIDWRQLWLPDILTIPLALVGLLMALWLGLDAFVDHAIGAIAGLAFLGLIGWVYRRIRGRDGLGLGDAKLLAASGAWVAWQGLPTVVLFGAALGLAQAFIMAAMGRPVHAATKLPFGTHLCLATWVVWLYGPLAI